MHHNTVVLIVAATAIAGVLWTAFWLWVAWMAVTVLRWRYLAVKAEKRPGVTLARYPVQANSLTAR